MIPIGAPMCESGWMRNGIEVRLGPGDRDRLEAVIGSGNSPQKRAADIGDQVLQRRPLYITT
jgi:hypothetical protein